MASTYVNDLRLNEMATGDASGSWGTVTNTNLELIGEAFSYGTETIGDADSTLTIADGAADAARSFYLKITSSVDLTTTRIVTLGPNTVSKVWMIENATTGSQVITIKQGSGATINVPNGQVKMLATDGAGSGGAVLDLLVDVDLTGTTTLVNLDVSGAVDIAGDLTLSAGGDGALRFTAASSVKVLDNNAAALVFEEADNAYMTFVTTDGSEAVKFDKALDINAATQIDATVTVGVDDTGYDVKFFGATAGAYMLWDESADDLILGGAAGLSVNSTALVTGVLTTTAATVFNGGFTANANLTVSGSVLNHAGLIFATQAILPAQEGSEAAANVIDIGANGNEFKSLYLNTSIINDAGFTLDSGGDIILDSDNGVFRFKDAGTTLATFTSDIGSMVLYNATEDKDLIFKGNDGGSTVTALTLDMSEAGNAIFNGNIVIGTAGKGIDFSAQTGTATGTTTSELLDSYEEGTWTPTLPEGGSLTVNAAFYTKIGRQVCLQAQASYTPTNNGSHFRIGGIPFVSKAGASTYSAGSLGFSDTLNASDWGILVNHANGDYLYFNNMTNGVIILNSAFGGSGKNLIFAITYITDS
jgi:hypothetical protein